MCVCVSRDLEVGSRVLGSHHQHYLCFAGFEIMVPYPFWGGLEQPLWRVGSFFWGGDGVLGWRGEVGGFWGFLWGGGGELGVEFRYLKKVR